MTNEAPPDGASHPAPADRRGTNARTPRRINRVVLQADVDAEGRRNLRVERDGDDVVIRGHDLGPVVTRAWGHGDQRVRVGLAHSCSVDAGVARRARSQPGR